MDLLLLCREHEDELVHSLDEIKSLEHQHHGAAQNAADAAKAERARHGEHVTTLESIQK